MQAPARTQRSTNLSSFRWPAFPSKLHQDVGHCRIHRQPLFPRQEPNDITFMSALIVPAEGHFGADFPVTGVFRVFGAKKAKSGNMQAFDLVA